MQPPWAAHGWAALGPRVRRLKLVEPDQIVETPTSTTEKVGLTVWIAVTGQRFTAPHVCTVNLSQRLIEPKNSRKLHHLALQLGIPLPNRHRAYDDAFATAHILVELLQLLHERQIATVGEMKLFESTFVAVGPPAGGNGASPAQPPAAEPPAA